ncbi:hypothetical protein OOJ09_12775 [Mesorhizobium qingshengii]|uniref:Uncharacterized protein n=1 Tax=Mesorhizobium qingshengii TaxID=1165689 RepID=A0ABT4QU15_9HYPH|nr:hypothetical protein [Mesorhizobium qingshengii]MCZ8545060.1 hypothetical protein [Mesorhizobium qingshengii]
MDATAADQAGQAADTGSAEGAALAAGTDTANYDPASAAGAAVAAATETEGAAPLYLCHKQVRALKIAAVEILPEGRSKIAPKDAGYAPFLAPSGWGARFHGSEDDLGYYVQYDDGYASWSPSKAFEDGYSLMPATAANGDQGDSDLNDTATVLSVAELARAVAGGARVFANGGMAVDFEHVFDSEEAAIMADFVRGNPEAPAEAMFIHLGLKKRYPRTEPNTADHFVLSLFHAACRAALKFEQQVAAEKAAAEFAAAPAGGWPGERALEPQKPAFSPSGFSPR